MENLIIENKGDQLILKLNRKGFDENFLISIVKRLKIEDLAQKSKFKTDILEIAEEIDEDWWDANGESFLKDVRK